MTAATSRRAPSSRSVAVSSRISASESALRFSGRLSMTGAILSSIVDRDAERGGDRLRPPQADARVARRFIALDLLLLQPEPLGERPLRQPAGDPRPDERVGELRERVGLQDGDRAALQCLVLRHLL